MATPTQTGGQPDCEPPEEGGQEDTCCALTETHGEEAELKVRLSETATILQMALNNHFVDALELCNRR